MAKTCERLRAMSSKLNHLDLDRSITKSSPEDDLRNCGEEFFSKGYSITKSLLQLFYFGRQNEWMKV